MRGYGRSAKPTAVADYRMVRNVSDAVVDALGEGPGPRRPRLGAPIAWTSGPFVLDRFRGVAGPSVPHAPPSAGPRPTAAMRAMAGPDAEFYVEYFQSVGRAEAEIEKDVRQWLLGFYWCAGGNIENGPNISLVPKGTEMRDQFQYPAVMPSWMTEEDLDYYTAAFEAGASCPCRATATSTGTGRTSGPIRASPSSFRPCLLAAIGTVPPFGSAGHCEVQRDSAEAPSLGDSRRLRPLGAARRSEGDNALLLDWLGALP